MFKKIMSLMLAIVVLMSVAVVATSAAQVEIADNSAGAVAEVGAAADAADTSAEADAAETAAGQTISFDATSAGWKNFKKVFCHFWAYDGSGEWPSWQSKAEACEYDEATGIATYDLSKTGNSIDAGTLYAVIFSNENGMQTYNLLFGTECIGDTAYCDGTEYENPEDSSKTALAAFWKGQDKEKYGPVKVITSIGNVVGTCVPSTTSSQDMFENFLKNTITNARTYAKKDDGTLKNDQEILDDTAKQLGLKQDDVEAAIKNTGVKVEWDKSKSTLEGGSDPSANKKPDDSSSTTKTTTTTTSNNNSSTSTTKTGSGSTTKTGQETTVLFIMLGIMVAAAGVIVVARKRDRA